MLALSGCDSPAAPADAGAPDAPRVDSGVDAGPPPDDSPYKGPLTLHPTTTSIHVRWESRLAPAEVALEVTPEAGGSATTYTGTTRETQVQLEYGVGSPLVSEPDVPGTYYVNDVDITALQPATCYRYSVVGWPSEGGRFCTMHEPTDHTTPIRFYAIGDTSPGVMGTVRILEANDPATTEFTVHVGDIQYYSAIVESQQLWFRLMEPLLRANAFLPCLGNHESERDHELEDIYLRLFGGAGEGTDLWYTYETGGVHFFSLSTEDDLAVGSEQYEWFVAELDRAEASEGYRFSVVYFHRPYYSVGDYRPRLDLRESMEPVITSHRVPLVLAGHMHGYERFEIGDVRYITTGAGGFTIMDIDQLVMDYPEDAARRVAAFSHLQAMYFEIVGDEIHGEAVDDLGMVRDEFTFVAAP